MYFYVTRVCKLQIRRGCKFAVQAKARRFSVARTKTKPKNNKIPSETTFSRESSLKTYQVYVGEFA